MYKKKIAFLAFLVLVSTGTWAHDDRTPHYLVFEIPTPDLADPQCVPGYATSTAFVGLNSHRFAAGGGDCYHDNGLTPEGRPNFSTVTKPMAWSPLTGSYLLPFDGTATPLAIDEHNNAYGFQSSGSSLDGVKWSAGGGAPQLLFPIDSDCGWGISIVTAANDRGEAAGWAARATPGVPFSCNLRAVVRKPSGEEVLGPENVTPSALTNTGMVGITVATHAAKWNFRTGEITQLRPDSDPEQSLVYAMNDRGTTAGNSAVFEPSTFPVYCARSKVVLWDARNRESILPNPAGAVSSWPQAINEDDVVVGFSRPQICNAPGDGSGRATIWVGGRATDLNRQIVGRPGVVLNSAIAINDRGEILATGFRAWEPKKPCPQIVLPPDGESPYTDDSTCHDSRAYLLIPID